MAKAIVAEMNEPMHRLQQLGLGYLSLDRAGSTLSNGELQRVQLARAVRTRTTGVLYVLDEPSIGLHPSNVEGLLGVIDDLMGDGNSVVVVDHDLSVLRATDYIVEIGPGSGSSGGRVIAQGTVGQIEADPASRIGPYLSGAKHVHVRERANDDVVFEKGAIRARNAAPAYREIAFREDSPGTHDGNHRRLGIGKDHPHPREPHPCAASGA